MQIEATRFNFSMVLLADDVVVGRVHFLEVHYVAAAVPSGCGGHR